MATQYVDILGEGFVQGVPGTFANCRVYYDGSQILHIGALYVDWPTPPPPARTGVSVTVTAFGAAGNATADDTLPIQNAINAVEAIGSGIITFPPGNYLISASLIVDNDNIALVGLGQRGSAPTIQIASSADPAYALIVGNSQNVAACLVEGLTFIGRNTTTSTGGGINFRSGSGKISQVKVAFFGGIGINLASVSGTINELFLDDVNLIQNGMNTGTPGNNLVVGGSVSDCEYHRVVTAGNSSKNTTLNGIYVNGASEQKFVDCHAYFCSHDGMNINSGSGLQVIGGEYETNGANGIESAGTNVSIIGIAAFGNSNVDVAMYGSAVVQGCTLTSTAADGIYASSSTGGVISGNILSGAGNGIFLDTGSTKYTIADNVISASSTGIATKSTHSMLHDNSVANGIAELTGANNNIIHGNDLTSGSITIVGSATKVKNNQGYNPVGQVTAPTFPATTVAATNTTGVDVTAFVANGTSAITQVQVAGQAGSYVNTNFQIAANGWGAIRIPAGGSVKFTYGGGTPAWTWFGD